MYNVIKFLVITFDEEVSDLNVSVLYNHSLNFTIFVIAFADNAMHFYIK